MPVLKFRIQSGRVEGDWNILASGASMLDPRGCFVSPS